MLFSASHLMEQDNDDVKFSLCKDNFIDNSNDFDTSKNEEKPTLSTAQKKAMAALMSVFFVVFMAYSNFAPFLPEEAMKRNVRGTVIGVIFSIYPAVMIFGSPAVGMIVSIFLFVGTVLFPLGSIILSMPSFSNIWSYSIQCSESKATNVIPRFGSKMIFHVGLVLLGSSYITFSMVSFTLNTKVFTIGCIIIRFIEGIGASCVLTGFFSITLEYFSDHITKTFALQQYAIGIGSIVGPLLGSLLHRVGGFLLPFSIFGACIYLTIPINIYFISRITKRTNLPKPGRKASIVHLFRIPEILVSALVVVASGSIFGFIYPTLEPAINSELQLTSSTIALLFCAIGISYSFTCIAWGAIVTRWGGGFYYMALGLIFSALMFLLLGPSPLFYPLRMNLALVITSLTLLGVFCAMHLVPTLELMQKGAINFGYADDIDTHGLISGIWSSCMSLGECIGPLYGSALVEFHSFAIGTSIQALICFCVGLLVFGLIGFNIVKETRIPTANEVEAVPCEEEAAVSCGEETISSKEFKDVTSKV
ncbi:MFS-type transporter SLC18B1 [Nymphon striatum]|nr:MFS-type transporter SLC18B1 [Nymphon striatum]